MIPGPKPKKAKELREFDLNCCFEELPANRDVNAATRLSGLPFVSADIAQVSTAQHACAYRSHPVTTGLDRPFHCHDNARCVLLAQVVCGVNHVGFCLKDGRVYQLGIKVLQKKARNPVAEIPERAELRECQVRQYPNHPKHACLYTTTRPCSAVFHPPQAVITRHHEVVRRLKKSLIELKKIDHGVDEEEIQTLVEITAKSGEIASQQALAHVLVQLAAAVWPRVLICARC